VKLTGEIIRLSHTIVTVNHKGTKGKMGSVEILSLSILLKKAMRVTPSLPQRGRQPKGSIS
jgi:hypothetical protein